MHTSRPLWFLARQSVASGSVLTAVHTKDTTQLLLPTWQHLSPSLAALLAQNLSLKHNLWRWGKNQQQRHRHGQQQTNNGATQHVPSPLSAVAGAARLTKVLYFRPHPTAVLKPTRNKSHAAAYVTPQLWGTLLGCSLVSWHNDSNNNRMVANILRTTHGIRSNHVNETQWTGVSLARWHELIRYLTAAATTTATMPLLPHAVWSMYLWDICTSKRQLLDAYLAAEQAAGVPILDDNHPVVQAVKQLKQQHDIDDPETVDIVRQWEASQFDATLELDKDALQAQWERLLTLARADDDSTTTISCLENVCANIATSHQATQTKHDKPACPNGHYNYQGVGDVKPDCVEVAVREVMDLLLWNADTGRFDTSRLPIDTAHPILYDLYRPRMLVTENDTSNQDDKENRFSLEALPVEGGGQEWFDALSDLPGCDYLSVNPHGKAYELTPTLRNMAKVLRRLLLHNKDNDHKEEAEEDWNSLKDLQAFWQAHPIQLSLDVLKHKAGMSDDTIVHEVATIAILNNNNDNCNTDAAIEMRLRCDWARNTGFATVTHLRNQQHVLDEKSQGKLLRMFITGQQGNSTRRPLWVNLLALATLGDYALLQQSNPSLSVESAMNQRLALHDVVVFVLSSSYGLNRRSLMKLASTTDLEREERALQAACKESASLLKIAIRLVSKFLQDSYKDNRKHDADSDKNLAAGVSLLAWILAERPEVLEVDSSSATPKAQTYFDSDTERAVLSLPLQVLNDPMIKHSLQESSLVRGPLINALTRWRNGDATLLQILASVGPTNVASILWLSKSL